MPTSSQMRCLQNHGYIYPASGLNNNQKQNHKIGKVLNQVKPSALQRPANVQAIDETKKISAKQEIARKIRQIQPVSKPEIKAVPQSKSSVPASRVLEKGASLERVLQAQKDILNMALTSLNQWHKKDQDIFKTVFNSIDQQEKNNVYTSIKTLLDFNETYQASQKKGNNYDSLNKAMQQQSLSPDESLKALFPKSKNDKIYTYCMQIYQHQFDNFQARLQERIALFQAAQAQLKRWSTQDQDRFEIIFGDKETITQAAVYSQIDKALQKCEARAANDNNNHKLMDLRIPGFSNLLFSKLKKPEYLHPDLLYRYCALAYVSRGSKH